MAGHLAPSADADGRPASVSSIPATRRVVLGGAGLALGAALGRPGECPVAQAFAQPEPPDPQPRPTDAAFHRRAREVREGCARNMAALPVAPHPANDDERLYPTAIAMDTRALPHDARGEVEPAAWQALLTACRSGDPADFERVPLGGTVRLGNPVGPLAVSLAGLNPTQIAIPPAPPLASAERAAEAVEVYWQALLRDVPFAEYHDGTDHPGLRAACAELNRLSDFRGPRREGQVTPGTLFRGDVLYFDPNEPRGRTAVPPGVLEGPVISQLLLRDVPMGAQWLGARIRPATPANEFLTEWDAFLRAQNGQPAGGSLRFEAEPRYISNGRDLAESVRTGVPQVFTTAFLLAFPVASDARYGGLFPATVPVSAPSNPYRRSRNQIAGAATFGLYHLHPMVMEGLNFAVRASYWQKWNVHRTLRPEAYGGLAQMRLAGGMGDYPLHDEFLRSEALDRTRAKQGSFLLSQNAPNGAPIYPSYPGGAASAVSAAVTLLKAFFDESLVIADPVQPDPRDPTRLVPYVGPPLTLGGELNKLAANLATGRAWMGIHFRSDASAAFAIGEEVALSLLRDDRLTYREPFEGFALTRFDGTRVTV